MGVIYFALLKSLKRRESCVQLNMIIQTNKVLRSKTIKKLLKLLIFVLIFDYVLFPAPILASEIEKPKDILDIIINFNQRETYNDLNFDNFLPVHDDIRVVKRSFHAITAYNSEVGQCDNSPCITANGFNVCEHGKEDTIAANFLRFGTKVKIPELFGDRIFFVRDRMNKKYSDRVDIWMKNKSDAVKFGIKRAQIVVVE